MFSGMGVTAADYPHCTVLLRRFVDCEPHRHEASLHSPKVRLLMPGNFETVGRLLEELCPEQHHVASKDLGDRADYLRKRAQLVNQPAVKMPIERQPSFRRQGLMAGRRRWKQEHFS